MANKDTSPKATAPRVRKPQPKAKTTAESASKPTLQGEKVAVGDTVTTEMKLGDKIVIDGHEIEYVQAPPRAGLLKPEKYPFSKIPLAVKMEGGILEGPSFFIPEDDNPQKHVTAARKNVRKVKGIAEFLYHERASEKDGVSGKMIFKTSNPQFKGA